MDNLFYRNGSGEEQTHEGAIARAVKAEFVDHQDELVEYYQDEDRINFIKAIRATAEARRTADKYGTGNTRSCPEQERIVRNCDMVLSLFEDSVRYLELYDWVQNCSVMVDGLKDDPSFERSGMEEAFCIGEARIIRDRNEADRALKEAKEKEVDYENYLDDCEGASEIAKEIYLKVMENKWGAFHIIPEEWRDYADDYCFPEEYDHFAISILDLTEAEYQQRADKIRDESRQRRKDRAEEEAYQAARRAEQDADSLKEWTDSFIKAGLESIKARGAIALAVREFKW
jgi:hypothetical protein